MITIKINKDNKVDDIYNWVMSKNIGAWGWTIGSILPMHTTTSCVTSITFIRPEDAAAFRLSFDV
jgi:hypothetical protein